MHIKKGLNKGPSKLLTHCLAIYGNRQTEGKSYPKVAHKNPSNETVIMPMM
jgi:hypothetical protein